jgi:hypothetical protein
MIELNNKCAVEHRIHGSRAAPWLSVAQKNCAGKLSDGLVQARGKKMWYKARNCLASQLNHGKQ